MNAVTDEQLLNWIANGDESLLGTLFERHHVALFNFSLQMLQNRAQAEDLVQETFLRMLRFADRFRGEGSVKAWMFNIARNLIYDVYRQQKRQAITEEEDLDGFEDQAVTPEIHAQIGQNQQLLVKAMTMLSETAREALWLGRFQFERYEELGQALGCTTGNARVRVHRAVKQLRQHYLSLSEEAM